MNTKLQEKIRHCFPEESVLKNSENASLFAGFNVPSFIRDYLVRKFTNNEILDKKALLGFLSDHIPSKGSDVRYRLLTENEDVQLITRFRVSTDIRNNRLVFSIPDLDIYEKETDIPLYLASENKDLTGGDLWGAITLRYIPPMGNDKGVISLVKYKPFRPYKINLEYLRTIRRDCFSLNEWIDLLLCAMEYNTDAFDSMQQKLEFIDRLMVFVQPHLNLIELAPKGTGKSYVFGNLSKYGWMISGGIVSRAKLFYDMQKKAKGAIASFDFVAMDEIQTIKFSDVDEMKAALKSYLEQGWATIGNVKIESECGLILMGNIPLNSSGVPRSQNYLGALPKSFQESALFDRFHGFIEGWHLPRIKAESVLQGWTLNTEYFSEILHSLRSSSIYENVVLQLIDIPSSSDMRDTKAIVKIATAKLKLLFPHVTKPSDIDACDFKRYCLSPAIRMRSLIREQIHLIDPEFPLEMPKITVKC